MTTPAAAAPVRSRRRIAFQIARILIILLCGLVALVYFAFLLPFWGIPFSQSRHGVPPLTPPWALECWLWEDDRNNADAVRELLEGYARHDIPVRTILIDSPWSLRYNDFKVDESRYPEPEKFFRGLQDQGYRVALWMTCMVDSRNKDTKVVDSRDFFNHARTNQFLAGNGAEIKWWKGRGGFIDYTNPEAMKWWRALQQQVFDWGIDAWKLDGADTLLHTPVGKIPLPFARAHSGWITTRQYMDRYARDEYRHGLAKNPEFVTLIRAKDRPWTHPEGFAPIDAAPVTWVGDNKHTWGLADRGLQRALTDILDSARLGYCVIGSDVAGYHGRSNPDDIAASGLKPAEPGPPDQIAPDIYIRWAQFSAFCGLFLNGGHGERRLWKRSPAELEIIRKFSWLHTELVPYIYSQVVERHRGGPPLMRPLEQGKYHYLFGDSMLVAPIYQNQSTQTVTLPSGRWRYFFDDAEALEGPAQISRSIPLDQFPVFIREGAIVPMKISRPYTGFGDTNSAPFTTFLIDPAPAASEFTLWHPESHPNPKFTTVRVTAESGRLAIEISGQHTPHILRIHSPAKPESVILDRQPLSEGSDWTHQGQRLVIRSPTYQEGHYAIIYGE